MIALLLTILLSAGLYVLLREADRRGCDRTMAISVNYLVCLVVGALFDPASAQAALNPGPALGLGLLQGVLFITVFSLIALGSARVGVGYTTLVSKISLVVPFLVSIVAFQEKPGLLQWLGVVLAFAAIVLVNYQLVRGKGQHTSTLKPMQILLLGIALFVGNGLIDTNFKLFDEWYPAFPGPAFSLIVFGVAASIGLAITVVRLARGQVRLHWRDVLAGICIGVPNYFSIITLIEALKALPGTVFFPSYSIGLLLTGAVAGRLLYRERFDAFALAGLLCAVAAIILILQ